MKLEDRCLKEFDSVIRARGEDDFRSRLVELELVSETVARFRMKGAASEKDLIAGHLDWSDADQKGVVRAGCSCRAFARGEFCQHVWAALLEMDQSGQSKAIGGEAQRVSLVHARPGEIPQVPKERALKTLAAQLNAAPVLTARTAAPVAGWKSLLLKNRGESEVASPAEKLPSRKALYFVNLEKSRQSGRLALELRYQERLKSGEWGAIKASRSDSFVIDEFGEFDDEQDRAILGLLLSPINSAKAGFEIDPLLMPSVLPQLVASERLYLQQEQGPLGLGEDEWDFEIEVVDEKTGFRLDGILRRGREKISLKENRDLALLSAGYFVRDGGIERVDWGSNFDLARHLSSHSVLVPREEEADFVMSVAGDADLPSVNLPPALQWPFVQLEPRSVARLRKTDDPKGSYAFDAVVAYGELEVDATTSRKILLDPVKRARIKRDMKTEKAHFKTLKGPFALSKLKEEPVRAADVPTLIQRLQENGWHVELERQPLIALSRAEGVLRKKDDDFVMDSAFDFEGEKVSLAAFFASCAKGERYLRLNGGRLGFLPDEWIKRIDLLLRGAAIEKDGTLRFKRSSLPLFRPVFEEIPGLKIADEAKDVFVGLEKLIEPGAAEKPRELKANLRSYQAEGLAWLESIAASGFGGILADDMGLGKTIQIISYLLRRATVPRTGPRPSLVILPKSLVFNWLNEVEKFGPRLRVLDFAGANRGMLKANDYDVVVTTYHVLKNEIDRFAKIEFDTIILDEAQTIKNPGSQIAQAVYQLKGLHRFALSGTPIENSLGDLFSLMRFTNPGLIPAGVVASIGEGRAGTLSKDALERLSVALSPFILRRTKKQVLTELPDKSEQALLCELEPEQKKLYDRLRKQYRDSLKKEIAEKGLGGSKMQVLEALLRLRQACCHPGLVDESLVGKASAKFEILLEHLDEIRSAGHKTLIFSQFTSLLGLLKPELDRAGIRYEYLDGQTRDRGAVVERFNSNPSTSAFLISLKAGGTGLNLTTASYVFLLDPWWNPAAEAQAIDRAYRMGQKQKVMAYRLIAQGTIEEKIMRLQAQKRSLAEAVISEDSSFLRSLSADDLASMFE